MTTFVKLTFKMPFKQQGEGIELFFSIFVGECAIILVDSLQGEGHNLRIHNVLFGGKYGLGIFLPTKSAAVRLFHRC